MPTNLTENKSNNKVLNSDIEKFSNSLWVTNKIMESKLDSENRSAYLSNKAGNRERA